MITRSLSLLALLTLTVGCAAHGGHGHGNGGGEHTHGFLIKAHGTLLTLSFSFLYPIGVILLRSSLQKSFLYHWTIQGGATVSAMIGMLFMIVRSWDYLISGQAGTHHLLGSAIFIAVCLQVVLGYYHHVLFVKLRRRTLISYAHIVLGWFIMCGGWINTVLGYQMGGISTPIIIVWLVWLVVASILMVQAPRLATYIKARERVGQRGKYDALEEQPECKERRYSSDTLGDHAFSVGE